MKPQPIIKLKGSTLRLRPNEDGTYTDQYGRLLERFTDKDGKEDYRPIGLDPRGANH
jgi:hypothetical protein